jgi:crossover junction endodeoxyribonuclease RusA
LACNPNSRPSRHELIKAKRDLRWAWAMQARNQGAQPMQADALHLVLTFVAPDRRARDVDNCLSACKAGLDGLRDVLGVDDSRWTYTLKPIPADRVGGFVEVEVTT